MTSFRRNSRIAIAALVAVAVIAPAAMAAPKKAAVVLKNKKLSIYGWTSSPEEDSALTGLVGEFNKKTGAKAVFNPQKEYDAALQAALASGPGPTCSMSTPSRCPTS